MTDNTEWLQRVVFKLNQVHLNGSNFFEERWIFDWDDNLSNTENFKNIQREERALSTLNQSKVVKAVHKNNFYRDQEEETRALHGRGLWTDFEGADPALRLYDYIWYLWEFDYDRFLKFCETHEFNPNENPTPQSDMKTTESDGKHTANLHLVQRSLKLNYNGIAITLKRFDSTKRFNYHLAKYLFSRPDEWVSKDNLGTKFKFIRSKAKDWPKLMGFTGELKDIFVSVNTKKQTIMLNPHKSLDQSEAAILERLVNTPKPK